MGDIEKVWSVTVSRRSVLRGATYAVAAAPIVLATADRAAAAKMPQGFSRVPQLAEWQPELRELQALRRTFVLSDRSRPDQSEGLVQDLRGQSAARQRWGVVRRRIVGAASRIEGQ